MRLQLFNLREIIGLGMLNSAEDSQELIDSLEYQRHYQKFLKQADKIAELSLKFWKILLLDIPDMANLNNCVVNLFKTRKKLMNTVNEINKFNVNDSEFFVKYGLFMRLIMNDVYASSMAYNNTIRASEVISRKWGRDNSTSLFRNDVKMMIIAISLETRDFMIIKDANEECRHILQIERSELIGTQITTLMPQMIAQAHNQYLQKFFQTMESTNIGIKRLRFLKRKDNMFVPCRTIKNIVPRLTNGFQGVMFAYVDPKMSSYTASKKDNTERKVFYF